MSLSKLWVGLALAASCSMVGFVARAADVPRRSQLSIGVMDSDGKNLELIPTANVNAMPFNCMPQWSPDGASILFDSTPPNNQFLQTHLAIYHLDGPQKGTTDDLGLGNAPNWSPDGKKIAFFLNPGSPGGQPGSWTMNADGTDRKWLCNSWFPMWSPDGKTIVCTTGFNDPHELVLCDPATGAVRPFAQGKLAITWIPSWSPDSKKLAAIAVWGDVKSVVVYDVERQELDQLLWANQARGGLPKDASPHDLVWSPGGDDVMVSFYLPKSRSQWWRIGLGKYEKLDIDASYPQVRHPNWSPDGKRITFCSLAPAPKEEKPKEE